MNYQTEAKQLLEELVEPIPVFVRPMVKKGIEAKLKEIRANEEITQDDVIRAFLLASPGNMKQKVIDLLKKKNIDLDPYEDLLNK